MAAQNCFAEIAEVAATAWTPPGRAFPNGEIYALTNIVNLHFR